MNDDALARRWAVLRELLNEAQRRRWAAIEAEALGPNGIQIVVRTTGIARQTVKQGLRELQDHRADENLGPAFLDPSQDQRKPGGGRKEKFPVLATRLMAAMEQQEPGKVWQSVIFRWTCLSLRTLAAQLQGQHGPASAMTISALLGGLGFRVVNEPWAPRRLPLKKRAAQYRAVAQAVTHALDAAQPVVVLDLSKGRHATDWLGRDEKGEGARLLRADRSMLATIWGRVSPDEETEGEAVNMGGWSEDAPDTHTVALAVQTVRQWWDRHGHKAHEKSGEVLVVANAMDIEGDAPKRWRTELSRFALDARIGVRACYLPPGICRWSHVAHQLGAVLGIEDPVANTARHQVVCRVIDWTSLPEHASRVLGRERRETVIESLRSERPPPSVNVRYQRPDAPGNERDWDFSISIN